MTTTQTEPRPEPALTRFAVGALAALFVPIVKLAQNGVDVQELALAAIIGAIAAPVILSIGTGLYAMLIERKEHDMKRLFKLCLALPALALTLFAGKGIQKVGAAEIALEVPCKPSSAMVQGLNAAWASMSNKTIVRYYLISNEKKTGRFVMVGKVKWYIIAGTAGRPKAGTVFDVARCKILPEKKVDK